jgi:hypothetical protein
MRMLFPDLRQVATLSQQCGLQRLGAVILRAERAFSRPVQSVWSRDFRDFGFSRRFWRLVLHRPSWGSRHLAASIPRETREAEPAQRCAAFDATKSGDMDVSTGRRIGSNRPLASRHATDGAPYRWERCRELPGAARTHAPHHRRVSLARMALMRPGHYIPTMETPAEIRTRWRYLRDLLLQQLDRFESGSMQMHSAGEDVSVDAIALLKKNILDFDTLIARSQARDP